MTLTREEINARARIYNKKYREKHREEYNARARTHNKKYREKHRDEINRRVREKRHASGDAFRAKQRAYYAENKDRINAYDRAYYAEHKQHIQERQAETRRRNRATNNARVLKNRREKYGNAHHQVLRAIERGEIIKQPCEKCGATETQAHHDDYNKPLDVRWLCDACHKEWHRNNTPKYIKKV